jgi:hypothetical protein
MSAITSWFTNNKRKYDVGNGSAISQMYEAAREYRFELEQLQYEAQTR